MIAPNPYLDGTELDEPPVNDYTRLAIPNDNLNWSNDATPQQIVALQGQMWPTAVVDWGPIYYWALCDSAIGGHNILVGDLENPLQIFAGDQAFLAEGDLSVSLGPFFMIEEL